jgi:hypothetical protein
VLFKLIKLWFKLAGMLISVLAGAAAGVILTRAGEITAREDKGRPPVKAKASQPPAKTNASSPARRRDHGQARAQT